MLTQPLPNLVSKYKRIGLQKFDQNLNSYRTAINLDALLKRALYSDYRLKLCKEKSHQYDIATVALHDMECFCQIAKVREELVSSTSFEQLLISLYFPRKIGLITHFGSICIYDSALRIGVNITATARINLILPDYVYIHNGSKSGALNLFKSIGLSYSLKYHSWDTNKEFPYMETYDFPSPLNTLSPHHIENFLCIYKDQL